MLEADIDENTEKTDEISREINRIEKIIRKRRQKHRQYGDFSLRVFELENAKTELRIKIDAL